MDPACGSGTFLVRAYARKRWLDGSLDHPTLLSQLYGVDISGYAVHLSALGLASREFIEANNYPRVDRKDFFDVAPESKFMSIPQLSIIKTGGLGSRDMTVRLPHIDAGVGNPPYVRQEQIPKPRKTAYQNLAKREAPTFEPSGRSDIYVYFWPHLASFLNPEGCLGLLTSSSWLDVEYGFRLHRWFLESFKILAILESTCEPWFEAARVATAVTIVQPCADESERMQNPVRFVQLRVPLARLLENDGTEDGRQRAAERLRDLILTTNRDTRNDELRILVRTQRQLWDEGCRLGAVLTEGDDEHHEQQSSGAATNNGYHGSKWGIYLRAPDLFFEITEKYEAAFVPLADIAEVRFGVKSGCDDFFLPHDITKEALTSEPDPRRFRERYHGVPRARVESGEVKIVRAGDDSVWPIESEYLQPELHSSMEIDSVLIEPEKLTRLILLVDKPRSELRNTHVLEYLKYGERETFGGDHPVPERPTCASRQLWYNLKGGTRGEGFWSKGQKYRHLVAWNKERIYCNCRVYDVIPREGTPGKALIGLLNSTLVAFFKQFYGRQAGTEGTLEVMVLDANMLPVPDLRQASADARKALEDALEKLTRRDAGLLLEGPFLEMVPLEKLAALEETPPSLPRELSQPDRQELDSAVLALIGVAREEIPHLLHRLYRETTLIYRRARILDIRTAANKRKARKVAGVTASEIAEDVWHSLAPDAIRTFPDAFLDNSDAADHYVLPDGHAKLIEDLFHGPRLKAKAEEVEFRHIEQAQLALALHEAGIHGAVSLPSDPDRCREVLAEWRHYRSSLKETLRDAVSLRTPDEDKTASALKLLLRWAVSR